LPLTPSIDGVNKLIEQYQDFITLYHTELIDKQGFTADEIARIETSELILGMKKYFGSINTDSVI